MVSEVVSKHQGRLRHSHTLLAREAVLFKSSLAKASSPLDSAWIGIAYFCRSAFPIYMFPQLTTVYPHSLLST